MVTILRLPIKPAPKLYTANANVRTLSEHAKAFSNVNNKTGFIDVLNASTDDPALANALIRISEEPFITKSKLRAEHTELVKHFGKKFLKYSHFMETVARLFGFKTYAAACAYSRERNNLGVIYNRYFGKPVQDRLFTIEQTKRDFFNKINKDFPK